MVVSGCCLCKCSAEVFSQARPTISAFTSMRATTLARRGSKSSGVGGASRYPIHRRRSACPLATMTASLPPCSTTSTVAPSLGITSCRRTWARAGSPSKATQQERTTSPSRSATGRPSVRSSSSTGPTRSATSMPSSSPPHTRHSPTRPRGTLTSNSATALG